MSNNFSLILFPQKTIAAIKAVGRFTSGSAIFRNRKANEIQDVAKLVKENSDGNAETNENSENKINLNEHNTNSTRKDIEFIKENGNTAHDIRDKEINNDENTKISDGITNNERKEVLENVKTGEISQSKTMQHKEDALLTKTTETSPSEISTTTENKESQYKESSLKTNNFSDHKLTSFLEREYSKKIEVTKSDEIDQISDLEHSTNYMSHLAEERLMNKINKKKTKNDFLYWGETTDALKERALQRKLLRDQKHKAETGAAESSHVNILHGKNEGVRNLKNVDNRLKKNPSPSSEGYAEVIDKDGKSSSLQHIRSTSLKQNIGNYNDNILEKPQVNDVTPAKSNTESNEKQEKNGGNNARSNNEASENVKLEDTLQRQRRSTINNKNLKPAKKNLFDNNIFKINDEKSNKAPLTINNLEEKANSEQENPDTEKQTATSKPKDQLMSTDKNKKGIASPENFRKVKSIEKQNKEANKESSEIPFELTRDEEDASVEDIYVSNRALSKTGLKKRVIAYDYNENDNKKENGNIKASRKEKKDLNDNLKTIKLTADSQSPITKRKSLVDKQIDNSNDVVKILGAKTPTSPVEEKKRSVTDVTEEREKKSEFHTQKKEIKTTKNKNSKLPMDFVNGSNNSNSTKAVSHMHGLTNTSNKNKFNFKRHSEQDIPIRISSRSKPVEKFEESTVSKYANSKSPFKKLSDSTNAISNKRTEKDIHKISVDRNNNHATVNFENNTTSPKSPLMKINDKFSFENPELVTSDKLNRMQDKLYTDTKTSYTDSKAKELTCSSFIRRSSLQKHIDENGNFVPFIPLRGQAARSSFHKLHIPEGGVRAKLEAFSGK